MQYVMLIYADEAQEARLSPAEMDTMMGQYFAFTEGVRAGGNYVAGEALQPTQTATTVRVRDGATLTTDGPFAETREQLGGFYILNCKDLDEAIALAAKIPGAAAGCVEIRPVMVFG